MRDQALIAAKVAWLTDCKGFAHRGLHNASEGIIENSPSAIRAALDAGVGIEIDVQMSAGRVPMVFHDEILSRLCGRDGRLAFMKASELCEVPYSTRDHTGLDRIGGDKIITLQRCLEMVAGRVPLLIEVKSHWHGRPQMERELVQLLSDYEGAYGFMSIDPFVIETLLKEGTAGPVGLITRQLPVKDWQGIDESRRQEGRVHFDRARSMKVDFLAHHVADLQNPILAEIKNDLQIPLFSWAVSSSSMLELARNVDAIPIFEGDVLELL